MCVIPKGWGYINIGCCKIWPSIGKGQRKEGFNIGLPPNVFVSRESQLNQSRVPSASCC